MESLFSEISLKGLRIKNRLAMPPMVCFGYSDDQGLVSDRHINHYSERSQDGPGIMIIEATAVMKEGRAAVSQLGIWSDEHISGLSSLASTIKNNGALSIIQLHHAGLLSPEPVDPIAGGPTADEKNPRTRTLEIHEIEKISNAFIHAAIRAQKAGFDGVELHGAHGYLLNQFANSIINKREDAYGKDFTGRMKLITGIIDGIKAHCRDQFILGCRMGANTPTLEAGIELAKYLERLRLDYLSVSHGGMLINLPRPPKDFDYNWIVYSGTRIKMEVNIPVMVVNEIRSLERASHLIEKRLTDIVLIGRPLLADPHWVSHVCKNGPVNLCLNCRPKCRWYENSSFCPARKKMNPS